MSLSVMDYIPNVILLNPSAVYIWRSLMCFHLPFSGFCMFGYFHSLCLCAQTLSCAALQAPQPMGFSRQEYWGWVAISSSRGSSQPRDQTHVFWSLLHLQEDTSPLVPPFTHSSTLISLIYSWVTNYMFVSPKTSVICEEAVDEKN